MHSPRPVIRHQLSFEAETSDQDQDQVEVTRPSTAFGLDNREVRIGFDAFVGAQSPLGRSPTDGPSPPSSWEKERSYSRRSSMRSQGLLSVLLRASNSSSSLVVNKDEELALSDSSSDSSSDRQPQAQLLQRRINRLSLTTGSAESNLEGVQINSPLVLDLLDAIASSPCASPPVAIPTNTYFRDPRAIEERARLQHARIAYRLKIEAEEQARR